MSTTITAIIASLILFGQHYFPWRQWLRRDLPLLARYTLGALGLNGPLAVLFLQWGDHSAAIAVTVVTLVGGLTLYTTYWLDSRNKAAVKAELLRKEQEIKNGHNGPS